MPGATRAHPVVGEIITLESFATTPMTILNVDADVDFDGSFEAANALHNVITRYGNILIMGAPHDSGTQIDVILEGDLSGSDYVSDDGTVTGTIAACIVEDIINLGTVDSVDFTSGTVAVTERSNLITA